MMSSEPIVEVSNLSRSFGEVQALQGISFAVPRGQVAGFLGPNGAGKTTAMKLLTGSLTADGGHARICGFDIETHPIEAKQNVGYLPENNPLYLEQRVSGFLTFAATARGLTGAARKDALERVVEATGLQSVWGKFLFACSKGFRQRVGLAQAMLHDPPLLILDEPTNGLDPLQIVEMRELIRHLGKTKTVLLTSHVMPEVEALADRVILLQHGRVVADGQLSELQEGDGSTFRVRLEGNSANEDSLRKAAQSAGMQVASIEPVGDNLEDVFRRLAGKQGGDS